MKKRLTALGLVLVMLLALCGCAAAEGSTGIFYRVSGGKNEMVILGSIHIGNEAMYPMGEHITDAIAAADTLVFECDTESGEAMASTMGAMYYPAGETLQAHISEECYTDLEQVAQQVGYPIALLNALKPWAVMSMLSLQTTAVEMGEENVVSAMQLGVESSVQALAGEKTTAWLETTQEQLDVMDGFSPALQEYLLQSTCDVILDPDSISGSDADMKKWPEWWRSGDAEAFANSYLQDEIADQQPELTDEYHEKLVTGRNKRMAKGLDALLQSDEPHTYFVTIGLLHLVLPGDSVVSELEAMGYTVEQILP